MYAHIAVMWTRWPRRSYIHPTGIITRDWPKAKVRDLSGAVTSLSQSLKYNKRNTDARNLLGLIYYQMGEIVAALSEWVISVHFQERNNIAADYIQAIQNNPAKLKAANKVIQKYNLALELYAGE